MLRFTVATYSLTPVKFQGISNGWYNDQSISVDLDTNFAIDNKFQGIGIHGTHLNNLIGKRASHGCIRMKNEDLKDLSQYIQAGTLVVIVPGKLDIQENTNPKTIIKDKNN